MSLKVPLHVQLPPACYLQFLPKQRVMKDIVLAAALAQIKPHHKFVYPDA